ncbi:LacI family DNA-binding transcriptional regulator [Flavitalea flava]
MKKKKSINDIAKELNVAISTVSAVLNGKAEERRISPAMSRKVLEYTSKIGYKPNMTARSLRTGKSDIIGMLVEDIADPFFSSISRSVEKNAAIHNYRLFYSSTENNPSIAKKLIRAFRDRQVDGYIIAPPPGIEKEIQTLINDGFPLVLFDRYFPDIHTNKVTVNNYKGAFDATMHLLDSGRQNITFITLNSEQTQMAGRMEGYLAAMKARFIIPRTETIDYLLSETMLVQRIRKMLEGHPQTEALFFATNYLAISGLKAVKELNLDIPGDVALVGFDDNTHFNLFAPSITSVAQPIDNIAAEILRILTKQMHNKGQQIENEDIILNTELIIRNSSL